MTESLSQSTGFQILSHRVDFYGVCPECQKAVTNRNAAEIKQARP
jgi:Fe2+ or Zn2+ uptake regulation protein